MCLETGDMSSVPRLGRSLGGGHDNPLQYSCLENPVDRGAWRSAIHEVKKESDTTKAIEHAHIISCVILDKLFHFFESYFIYDL